MGRLGPFEENTIVVGDVIEVLSQLPDACVDAIVTDPPYGLEFMGKEWDKPSHLWHEGAYKAPDYKGDGGLERWHRPRPIYQAGIAYQSWTTSWATEAYRILKPGAYMLVMGGTRTHHRLGVGLEDAGFQILDEVAWIHSQGFPKNYDVSKGIDKRAGAEREVVGKYDVPDMRGDNYAQGRREYKDIEHAITVPATSEAKYWEGYGTALKPAHEPIWLCKKPNEGSYVDNVLKHGTGALNIDGSRVEYQSETDKHSSGFEADRPGFVAFTQKGGTPCNEYQPVSGRWPANVIVDPYPEEFQGGVVIEGEAQHWKREYSHSTEGMKNFGGGEDERGERNKYIPEGGLGDGLLGPYTRFFVIPKPSKAEKTCNGQVENKHVTVKPVRLGKWLIKLIAPHQHPVVLLDPFCGSGSFLMAAQELNYEGYQIEFFGIDKDKDSADTAMARLEKDRAARQMELL